MIVTLTANPSHDHTIVLPAALDRGSVIRVPTATVVPAGKGVNVARAATSAGVATIAVVPCAATDPLLAQLDELGVRHRAVPIRGRVRTNITLTEPDGTTTKINEPGPTLDTADVAALVDAVVAASDGAGWVVCAGSLPPGAPADLYATISRQLADRDVKVAVDTSGAPLVAVARASTPPNLIKPNTEELATIVGGDPAHFEANPAAAATAARQLVEDGIDTVLLTLGAAGTVAITANQVLFAAPLPIEPRSTVGAGDSSLTGWIMADLAGHDTATRLAWAAAWGAAAVSLPGSTLPTPDLVTPGDVVIRPLHLVPT